MTFSIAIGAHLVLARPPTCGCFGVMARFESGLADSTWALARNGVMLALLGMGWWLHARATAGERPASGVRVTATPSPRRAREVAGFTLIETLVVIALIAVVLSLVFPSLRGARRGAQAALSLSNLRQHAATMSAYTGDNAEVFPYLTDPLATYTVFRTGSGSARAHFFELHLVWNYAMADQFFAGDPNHGSFYMPYAEHAGATSYYYADCFIARPEFWRHETRTGPDQWRGTRQADVQFPSLKGIVRERHSWIEIGTGALVTPGSGQTPFEPVRFSRVDGSAGASRHADLLAFMKSGVGQWPVSYLGYGLPIMHTLDGVRGRDVE